MKSETLKLPERGIQRNFQLYYSDAQATMLCDGMITTAYFVDNGRNLCISTLSKNNGIYTHTRKIGNDIYVNDNDPEYTFIRFTPNVGEEFHKIPSEKLTVDNLTNALFLRMRSKNIQTFAEIDKIAHDHLQDIRQPRTTNYSTENLLLENRRGVYAISCFAANKAHK